MLSSQLDELPKDKTIVCICRSGNRSHTACEHLSVNGFTDVINLSGGMFGWRRAGLPYE
jgi:rhodanese-related sulfurtransferase